MTFITVVFSAYRASNLNIVVAIRGLKDEFVKKAPNPFKSFEVLWNLIYPIKQLYFIITGKAPRFRSLLLMMIFPVSGLLVLSDSIHFIWETLISFTWDFLMNY